MKSGSNIRQRKDGKFEARYIKGRDSDGKAKWGYCYGITYEEAEQKKNEALGALTPAKELNLLILGAGGLGTETMELAKALRVFHKIDFLDDDRSNTNSIGSCENFESYLQTYTTAIAAISDDALRVKWTLQLIKAGFIIPTLIHPSATISSNSNIGFGTIIFSSATVNNSSEIGKGCIINSGAIIEKGAVVPDWSRVESGEIRKEYSKVLYRK